MRRIAILDAPSNLGLRPPTVTSVPGCAKAPGALRDHGLLTRLHARDAGCLTPPRYDPGDWRPGDGVCHATEIAAYSRKLADRIGAIIDAGEFPVVLGGDCSIVLGSGLAMHRLGEAVGGRIGLVFVDGHSDFRHPGNASYVGAAAGEDLALVTGRGQTDLAAIEGRRPYFRDVDVVVMGIRAQDEYRLDLQAAGIVTRPVPTLRVEGAARSAQWARDQLVDCAGYWVHVDMDVLDPAVMPAVDAPEPGGIAFPELELLLAGLVDTPHCLGVEITVFDPDYDPDGAYAEEITSAIVAGLAPVRTVAARPDLIAARRDLAARVDKPLGGGRRFGLRPPLDSDPGLGAESDGFAERRAAAAAESVTLAAEAMSGGGSGPEEAAVPATTLLGVEEADEVESRPVPDELSDKSDSFGSSNDDEWAGETGDGSDGQAPGDGAPDGPGDDAPSEDAPVAPSDDDRGDGAPGDRVLDAAGDGGRGEIADGGADAAAGADDDSVDPEPVDHRSDAELGDAPKAADDPDGLKAADGADGLKAADDADGLKAADDADGLKAGDDADGLKAEDHPNAGHDVDDPKKVVDRDRGRGGARPARADGIPVQPVSRPLGSAPLLDSQPLPATRPGMLRPRTVDGFSLPAQRPAFDVGPGEPADIA